MRGLLGKMINAGFKPIPGFSDKYWINTSGIILSSWGRPMCQRKDKHGYMRVVFTYKGRKYNRYVHRLICLVFLPNPDNKPQVNHKNRIRIDNRLENLEWCTGKENIAHSFKNGRQPTIFRGESASWHKIKSYQIPDIRNRLKKGETLKSIGKLYGVSLHTIYSIKSGKNWKHI